jgi:ABC-type transport system involved in cytochrome c biogenesis permease component
VHFNPLKRGNKWANKLIYIFVYIKLLEIYVGKNQHLRRINPDLFVGMLFQVNSLLGLNLNIWKLFENKHGQFHIIHAIHIIAQTKRGKEHYRIL